MGDDTVWVAGYNDKGQLGDGTIADTERSGALTATQISVDLKMPTTVTFTTSTVSSTVTSSTEPPSQCAENEFIGSSVFDVSGFSKFDNVWTAAQLSRALGHFKWKVNETWTLSLRA